MTDQGTAKRLGDSAGKRQTSPPAPCTKREAPACVTTLERRVRRLERQLTSGIDSAANHRGPLAPGWSELTSMAPLSTPASRERSSRRE